MRDRPKREGELWEAMGEVGFASGLSRESAPGLDAGRLPDGSFLAGHPYLSFLHRLEKPGRYTGGEVHSIGRERDEARISIALAFPDAYEIGMSHLGFRILYSHLNAIDGVRAERVYAPWFDLESELRRRRLPLVSLETWTPLCRFDCVGFSFQYELTYTNVLAMLDLGGIPIHASDRTEEDPLVMAGGPVAFQPEPMAPFIDAYLIGDGEVFFHRTVEEWRRLKEEGASRRERLAGIAGMDGIYVPSLYRTALDERTSLEVVTGPLQEGIPERISRAHLADINEVPFPADSPVPNTEIVFDRASVEIARGCTEGCRFCQAGMIYRPVRERDPQGIRKAVRESVRCGGFDEVSLTSLSTADYSAIQPLVKRIMGELKEENVALSVSSLRAYGLSEEMLDDIASVRNTSLTFAPEAGTQRMRDVVNKNIFEEDIVKTAHRVFSRGWRKLKLYFMIGLPTEADEDVRGIAEMGRELLGIGEEYLPKRRLEVTLSVSSHVPKPFTPFQWAAQDSLAEIERKQQILREATRVRGLRFRWHDPHTSHLEGILGRGDRPIAAVIESAWRKGCRFDAWGDRLRFDLWLEAFEECGIDRGKYLSTLPVDGRVPWDHIDCGVEWGFLLKEYRKALKDRLSHPCGKPGKKLLHHSTVEDAQEEKRRLVCFDCGVACDLAQMREQRLRSLEALEARRQEDSPPPPTEQPLEDVISRARERARRRDCARPPLRPEQRRVWHAYRFRLAKVGPGRFVSHLDLVRLLPRAFRRAGLELFYSAGFHPQPVFSFGPPLRLGLAALSELFEVRLCRRVPAAELVVRLNGALPGGLVIRGGHEVLAGAPKLSRMCRWADYLVFLPGDGARSLSPEALEGISVAPNLPFERRRKDGTPRDVDLAAGIAAVELLERLPADARELLSLEAGIRILQLRLGLNDREMVRPEEVLWLLFRGRIPAEAQIVRRRLLPSPAPVAPAEYGGHGWLEAARKSPPESRVPGGGTTGGSRRISPQ